jgi:hypothetical protein
MTRPSPAAEPTPLTPALTDGLPRSEPRRELFSESAIYGLILVSALLLVSEDLTQGSWDTFVKVLGTVIVFWIAHVFAHIVAQLSAGITGSDRSGKAHSLAFRHAVRHAFAHSSGLLVAAIVPLVIVFAGVLSIISAEDATTAALWADVVLLGALGVFGAGGWTKNLAFRIVAGLLTALLGVAIIVLKAIFH